MLQPLRRDLFRLGQPPLGRVIDASLLAFLVFSVLSITIAQGAILVALIAWALKLSLSGRAQRLRLPLLAPMAGFFLASVLASFTAVDPALSLRGLRNVFQPALFYLVVNHVSGEDRATALTRVLIAMGTAVSLCGLSQAVANGPGFRVHCTMSIYMTFAGVLILIAPLALAQLLFNAHGRRSLWLVVALLMVIWALLMTQTRSAWLGLVAGFALIVGFRKKLFLPVLPLLPLSLFLLSPDAIKQRISSLFDPTDVTFNDRLFMWQSGLEIIRDHPWTGIGMGGLKRVYREYKHPLASTEGTSHLHSNALQVTAERGFIGLAFWLWIWVAYVGHVWRIHRSLAPEWGAAKALVVGSLACIIGFHVAGLFEYTFGDSEVIQLVYFVMALPFLAHQRPPDSDPLSGRAADG